MVFRSTKFINSIFRYSDYLAGWCISLLILLQIAIIVLRYSVGYSASFMDESLYTVHAFILAVGCAALCHRNGHIRVDPLYANFSKSWQNRVDLIGSVCLLIPFTIVGLWYASDYAWDSIVILEGTQSGNRASLLFVTKTLVFFLFFLLFVQGIGRILMILSKAESARE